MNVRSLLLLFVKMFNNIFCDTKNASERRKLILKVKANKVYICQQLAAVKNLSLRRCKLEALEYKNLTIKIFKINKT